MVSQTKIRFYNPATEILIFLLSFCAVQPFVADRQTSESVKKGNALRGRKKHTLYISIIKL